MTVVGISTPGRNTDVPGTSDLVMWWRLTNGKPQIAELDSRCVRLFEKLPPNPHRRHALGDTVELNSGSQPMIVVGLNTPGRNPLDPHATTVVLWWRAKKGKPQITELDSRCVRRLARSLPQNRKHRARGLPRNLKKPHRGPRT